MNEIKLTSTYYLPEVISALVQEGYTLEVKQGRAEDEIIIRWASADRKTEPRKKYPTEWCEECDLWRDNNCMGVAQCKRNIQILTEAYKAEQTEPQTERSE